MASLGCLFGSSFPGYTTTCLSLFLVSASRFSLQEQDEIFSKLRSEYDAGLAIRDEIIPNAVDWYLGRAEATEEDVTTDEEEEGEEEGAGESATDVVQEEGGLKKRPSKTGSRKEAENHEAINRSGSKTETSTLAGWLGF